MKIRTEKEIRCDWEKLEDDEKCRYNGYKDYVDHQQTLDYLQEDD